MISVFVLLPLYFVGIQFERGRWWHLVLPITLLALLVDIILNYTELAILTLDFPKAGEFTFSQRLARLKKEAGWRGVSGRYIARVLNAIAPSGFHV